MDEDDEVLLHFAEQLGDMGAYDVSALLRCDLLVAQVEDFVYDFISDKFVSSQQSIS